MNRAAGLAGLGEPEKRTGHREDLPGILREEKIGLIRVQDDYPFFTGHEEPDPEPEGIKLFFDPDDIPHVTATFPALPAPEYHALYPRTIPCIAQRYQYGGKNGRGAGGNPDKIVFKNYTIPSGPITVVGSTKPTGIHATTGGSITPLSEYLPENKPEMMNDTEDDKGRGWSTRCPDL